VQIRVNDDDDESATNKIGCQNHNS